MDETSTPDVGTPAPEGTPAPTPSAAEPAAPAAPSPEAAGQVAALQDERRKRQALEAALAARDAADAKREQDALKKRGEYKQLHEAAEARAAELERQIERTRRDVVLARKGLPDDGAAFAHFLYEQAPADDRPSFDEFLAAEVADGGRLHRFVATPEPHQPTGTRAKGTTAKPGVPAWIAAEAADLKRRGGAMYADLSDEEHAAEYFQRRYRGVDPRAQPG